MKIAEVDKRNFIVYIITFIISVLLIGLSFINPSLPGWALCSSLGTGGLGSVLVAYFIDLSANKREKDIFNKYLNNLRYHLFCSYGNIINCLQDKNEKIFCDTKIDMNNVFGTNFERLIRHFQAKYPMYNKAGLTEPSIKEMELVHHLRFIFSNMGKLQIDIMDICGHRFEFISYGYLDDGEIDSLNMINNTINSIQKHERLYDILFLILEFNSWNIKKLKSNEYYLEFNKETKQYDVIDKTGNVISF